MDDHSDFRKNFLHDADLFKQADPEDIEIAFQLQNLPTEVTDTLTRMVYRYSTDLYKWIITLIFYQHSYLPDQAEVEAVLKAVYVKAVLQADQFHGQASVMNWLFSIAYSIVRIYKYRYRFNKSNVSKLRGDNQGFQNNIPGNQDGSKLDRLSGNLRQVILLRYLFEKQPSDIAQILNIQKRDVHHRLVRARKAFHIDTTKTHLGNQIQAYLDGILDENPEKMVTIENHVTECLACQRSTEQFVDFERSLAALLKARWDTPSLDKFTLDNLIQSSVTELSQSIRTKAIRFPLRSSAWLLGLSVLFVVLAIIFVRLTPVEREFPTPVPTSQPHLPAIIGVPSNFAYSMSKVEMSMAPRYVEPDFSKDGSWVAIASIRLNQATGATSLPRIDIYNRESNTYQLIHESYGTGNPFISVWSLAPSISADGKRIVFVSSDADTSINGSPCVTTDHSTCLDIFLYDRDTGATMRLTRATDGGPANGDSLSPTISDDGRWVAFWSKATNLAPGGESTCESVASTPPCLFLYLNNLENETVVRIPVGTTFGDNNIDPGRISLSADGRYVGFTISIKGQPANPQESHIMTFNILGIVINKRPRSIGTDNLYTTEALVFDRSNGNIETENINSEGTLGNDASSSPVLSADGHYVAFVSYSTNLFGRDLNQNSDVFLRDRLTKSIDLVSTNEHGTPGSGDSGINQLNKGNYSLDMSSDGRYVVFESNAHNLVGGANNNCREFYGSECTVLFVHDNQTKNTEFVSWLTYGDNLSYPNISSDGRWISYAESFFNCMPLMNVCSNVMMFDRQYQWTKNLTNYGQNVAVLPWSYFGAFTIPWQSWESKTLSFSPDGKMLALGGTDAKIRIWQIDEANKSLSNDPPSFIVDSKSNDAFTIIKFNENGRWVAAGTTSGTVYIWKIPEGELVYTIKQPSDKIKEIVFSKDNEHLVISTFTNTSLWMIGDKKLTKINTYFYGAAIDVSPDGSLLASQHEDGTIWIQHLPEGDVIGRLGSGNVKVNNLAFSKDGKVLAVCSADYLISIWQLQLTSSDSLTASPVNTFQSDQCIGGLVFSPDNRYMFLPGATGEVIAWSIPAGQMLRLLKPPINGTIDSLAFSQESGLLGAVVLDNIILWKIHPDDSSIYFVHSDENTSIDSEPLPKATANDIPELQVQIKTNGHHLSIQQAADQLKFPPLVPSRLPEFMKFIEANVNEDGSVLLAYDITSGNGIQSKLYIYEKIINGSNAPTMTLGKQADIIPIQLVTESGREMAEYVQGDWFVRQTYTPAIDNAASGQAHDLWQWSVTSISQRLRWEQYGILIGLYYRVYNIYLTVLPESVQTDSSLVNNYLLGRSDIIQIASSMKWFFDVN